MTILAARVLGMTEEKTVPAILKKWREDHEISQEQCAALAQCSLSGWRNWESGRTSISAETISLLDKAYPGLWSALGRARP